MSLVIKNYSFVEDIYLLIRFNKTEFFRWNPKNADRKGGNKQNTQPHTKDSEKDNTEHD